MKQLAVLLTRHHRLLSVAALLDVFEHVNRFYETNGMPAFFNIKLISADTTLKPSLNGFPVKSIHDTSREDIILVPAFASVNLSEAIAENSTFLFWLHQQYKDGAEIASFCTGAFLLAAAQLLDGRKATTHVNAATAFAANFPKVRLQPDAVITEENSLYTSGGATSSFHLMLHLIKKHCGSGTAIHIAKMFAIDMDREKQLYFDTFHPPKDHGDELVIRAQQLIEQTFHKADTIERIIQDIPASRRNVVRRFKQATGITPIEYLQKTRIEAAKKLLEQTRQGILEVMLSSGYNDLKSFRQLFKKMTGMTPTAYREKFNSSRNSVQTLRTSESAVTFEKIDES